MNHRAKVMLMSTIFLCLILVAKSLWIDPVRGLEGDNLTYKEYAEEVAPHQSGVLILNSPVVTYRVVSVQQTSEEGKTLVAYENQQGEWKEEELQGQYVAKVRSYILSVLPIRDIRIKGGLSNGKQL